MNSQRAQRLLTLIALLFVYSSSHIPFSHSFAQQNTQQNIKPRAFNVSVVDQDGKPYAGLKPENFAAFVNDSPRKILSLTTESTPVSVGLLLDNSGSMPATSKKAGEEFGQRLTDEIMRLLEINNPENDYFVSQFDKKLSQTEWWTGADDSVISKLEPPGNYNGTALFDAVYLGIQHVMTGRHARRAILIISDGTDNGSKRTRKETIELIKKSDVTIYAIAIRRREEKSQFISEEGVDLLEQLAKASGGRALRLSSESKPEAVMGAFDSIAANLRQQYRLSVETDDVAAAGKWHKVKVELNMPEENRPKLYVHSRQGYYQ
jgi:Ca-activated chloride channel family protein